MKYPYLTVTLLVIFGLIDIAILGNRFGLDAATWPGWVQAVGSIAALAVAIFVMSRQNKHSAALIAGADRLAMKRRANAISVVMTNADWQVRQSLAKILQGIANDDVIETRAAFVSAKHFMGDVHRNLISIPLHELGSADMADGILRIIQVASVVVATSELDLTGEKLTNLKTLIIALDQKTQIAKSLFKKGIEEATG